MGAQQKPEDKNPEIDEKETFGKKQQSEEISDFVFDRVEEDDIDKSTGTFGKMQELDKMLKLGQIAESEQKNKPRILSAA